MQERIYAYVSQLCDSEYPESVMTALANRTVVRAAIRGEDAALGGKVTLKLHIRGSEKRYGGSGSSGFPAGIPTQGRRSRSFRCVTTASERTNAYGEAPQRDAARPAKSRP